MKPMFSKIKSRTRYYHYLCLPFLFHCCYLLIWMIVESYFRLNGAIYLSFSNTNIAGTLAFTLICVNILLFFIYYNRTVGKNDERDNISLQSNLIAKKITGKFVIVSTVIFIVSISLFYIFTFSRIEMDDEGLKQYNLIEEDVTLCKYDDVEKINVYLEWERRGKHDYGYTTIIKLKTNNDTYKLSSRGFNDDFSIIKQFLSSFDEDIITVDNTYSDEVNDENCYGYIDHPEIFEEIYK